MHTSMMIKKKSVKNFVATTKNNKSEILAGILGGSRAGARQKFFREIFL